MDLRYNILYIEKYTKKIKKFDPSFKLKLQNLEAEVHLIRYIRFQTRYQVSLFWNKLSQKCVKTTKNCW